LKPFAELSILAKTMVPATVGVGSGVALSLGFTDGAADGEFDAGVLEPPQAARTAVSATTPRTQTVADNPLRRMCPLMVCLLLTRI
jgi:hypothetical protein